MDWGGLQRKALRELRLKPAEFWALTPIELLMMLGLDEATPPFTRARLAELTAAFPDRARSKDDD